MVTENIRLIFKTASVLVVLILISLLTIKFHIANDNKFNNNNDNNR